MVKNTNQTKDLSGVNTYRYETLQIEIFPCFVYDISICKLWKNGFNILKSKFIKSNKQLKDNPQIIRFKNFIIVKYITLIGAPIEFIENNHLPKYELLKRKPKVKIVKNGKKKRNSR